MWQMGGRKGMMGCEFLVASMFFEEERVFVGTVGYR